MKFLTISLGFMMFAFNSNAQSIQTCLQPAQSKKYDPYLELKQICRSFDGTGNNIKNPQWGAVNADLQRLCEPNYADGKSIMWEQKPNVRTVDIFVGQVQNKQIPDDKNGFNNFLPVFGQFIDHDISMTPPGNQEPAPIEVPQCDLHFDPQCKGNISLPFSRSVYNKNKKVRTNINVITAYLDASNVYGSSKQTAKSLRSFVGGKLKQQNGMLTKNAQGFYLAGDLRANQNIGLLSIHTVFMREHNRLCEIFCKKYPKLKDEQIFTMARNYVIGLIQHIVFDEYLPYLVGKQNFDKFIGDYEGYDSKTNANIINEFSSAGYRLHSLVNYPFVMKDDNGKVKYTLKQSQMLSNPSLVTNKTIKQIFNGLISSPMKERTLEMTSELRNGLILGPDRTQKFDLYATNLQRGRDHGVCSIPKLRQVLGLKEKKQFCEIFQNTHKAEILQKLYQQLENVDLYLGILGQRHVRGSILGQIGIKINTKQFKKIRNGDRFWYECAYPEKIVKEIKKTTFTDILRRNDCLKNQWLEAFKLPCE